MERISKTWNELTHIGNEGKLKAPSGYRPTSDSPCVVKGLVYDVSGIRHPKEKINPKIFIEAPKKRYMSLLRDRIEIRKRNGKILRTFLLEEISSVYALPVYPVPHAFKIEFAPTTPGRVLSGSSVTEKVLHKLHYSIHHTKHSVVMAAINQQQCTIWIKYIRLCVAKIKDQQRRAQLGSPVENKSPKQKHLKKTSSLVQMDEWMRDPFFEEKPLPRHKYGDEDETSTTSESEERSDVTSTSETESEQYKTPPTTNRNKKQKEIRKEREWNPIRLPVHSHKDKKWVDKHEEKEVKEEEEESYETEEYEEYEEEEEEKDKKRSGRKNSQVYVERSRRRSWGHGDPFKQVEFFL